MLRYGKPFSVVDIFANYILEKQRLKVWVKGQGLENHSDAD
jgi:hypothetical protein